MRGHSQQLTVPAGPIRPKYLDFVENEDFLEMAFIGTFNTTKSTALVDWLILSGINYPGANLVLTRAKLSDLRRTTLTKYLSRAGKVLVDNFNKNEAVIEFPEINGLKSTLYMFGLDRVDLTEVLKSFEPFRAAVEESNEVPNRAMDLLLGRCRQKVYHRERTNRWYAGKMAALWGVPFERACQILGFESQDLTKTHIGTNQLKHVFNPEGNDHVWKRVVGIPYPGPDEMGPEWVAENVGIREFAIPPEEVGMYDFQAGDLVRLKGGERAFVAGMDSATQLVELVDGRRRHKTELTFIGQRAAIFAFTTENWSRNTQSDRAFMYMQDPNIRKQYFEGRIDTRKGLVFPEFERGVHVVPRPKRDLNVDAQGVVGVDQGFRHPTAALFGVRTKVPVGGVIILKEYLVSGRSAFDNAMQIKGMVPTYVTTEYWADPSMWRTEPTSLRSVADEYAEAGLPLYQAQNNIEFTINAVKELLREDDYWRTGERLPRLFVSEECEQLIHAMETCTHEHMRTSRDNWIVDMIDALRYLASGVYNSPGPVLETEIVSHVRDWS